MNVIATIIADEAMSLPCRYAAMKSAQHARDLCYQSENDFVAAAMDRAAFAHRDEIMADLIAYSGLTAAQILDIAA